MKDFSEEELEDDVNLKNFMSRAPYIVNEESLFCKLEHEVVYAFRNIMNILILHTKRLPLRS